MMPTKAAIQLCVSYILLRWQEVKYSDSLVVYQFEMDDRKMRYSAGKLLHTNALAALDTMGLVVISYRLKRWETGEVGISHLPTKESRWQR
jgi:hypothetical protein